MKQSNKMIFCIETESGSNAERVCDFERDNQILVYVKNFNHWYKRNFQDAQIFLDIMAQESYSALLMDRKFVTLINSDNPKLDVQPVGARNIYSLEL